jgi:hypothetical protein
MAAIDTLNTNLDKLEEIILGFKEKQLGLPTINFKNFLLTKRQTLKKIMISSDKNITEDDAHFIVYGKMKYVKGKLSDNEILDPDCVDKERCIKEEHTLMIDTTNKIKEFKKSIRTFMINSKELINSVPALITDVGIEMAAIPSALTALGPPVNGVLPGIANVIIMLKTLISSITEFLAKLPIILATLGPFTDILMLVIDGMIEIFLLPINIILEILNITLNVISIIYKLIGTLIATIP